MFSSVGTALVVSGAAVFIVWLVLRDKRGVHAKFGFKGLEIDTRDTKEPPK